MNPLAAQQFDDLLPELAQANAVARQLRMCVQHAKDVALGRIGIHAEQKIRRRQMEEAQRMRLHDLRQVHDAAQLLGRLGNAYRQDRVAGLGRSDQVADTGQMPQMRAISDGIS